MLLGWETALGGMQFGAEGKGPLGAGHTLGVWPVFIGLSSFCLQHLLIPQVLPAHGS